VRVEARFAMESAFSSVPSFFERGCEANRKRWRARGRPKREKLEKVPKPDKALAEHAVDFDPLIYNIWKQQEKTALEPQQELVSANSFGGRDYQTGRMGFDCIRGNRLRCSEPCLRAKDRCPLQTLRLLLAE
jgi:hypothetical protein